MQLIYVSKYTVYNIKTNLTAYINKLIWISLKLLLNVKPTDCWFELKHGWWVRQERKVGTECEFPMQFIQAFISAV